MDMVMNKTSVSRTRRLTYFQILGLPWKAESEANIKFCLGRNVELVQEFINNTELWTQLMVSRWFSSGIFSHDSLHCSSSKKSKIHEQNERPITIPKTKYLHVDVQWHHMGINDNEQECTADATLVSVFAKKFQQDVRHSSDLDQKRSVLFLTDHKENGTESLNWWWSNSEKADTQHYKPRVHCPEERSKAKVEKLSIHFCADGDTIEISNNHFRRSAQYLQSSLRLFWRVR